jgi:hypothetical protein
MLRLEPDIPYKNPPLTANFVARRTSHSGHRSEPLWSNSPFERHHQHFTRIYRDSPPKRHRAAATADAGPL